MGGGKHCGGGVFRDARIGLSAARPLPNRARLPKMALFHSG